MRFSHILFVLLLSSGIALGQNPKGIDPQTTEIKKAGNPNRGEGVSKSIDFGAGKTKIRARFPNPYRLNSRRDILIKTIASLLNEQKFIIDETASRFEDGLLVTQPVVFIKGPILTPGALARYAEIPEGRQVWTRGRYALRIEVRAIDGIRNDVDVTATVEGRTENGLFPEWVTLDSSGELEDEFLTSLAERTGANVDPNERKP
ncbi:MAG: hypothetical protein R2684_07650 [Pyrinomonadaceae bacterium]